MCFSYQFNYFLDLNKLKRNENKFAFMYEKVLYDLIPHMYIIYTFLLYNLSYLLTWGGIVLVLF